MLNYSNKLAEILHERLILAVELASLYLIWLGLKIMVILADAVSTKSTD